MERNNVYLLRGIHIHHIMYFSLKSHSICCFINMFRFFVDLFGKRSGGNVTVGLLGRISLGQSSLQIRHDTIENVGQYAK